MASSTLAILNGPRWEYAQFFSMDSTVVYFTHRKQTWSGLSGWEALHLLGEHGFELVNVTVTVDYYEGAKFFAGGTGALANKEQSSLYVLKRLVSPDEPLELPALFQATRAFLTVSHQQQLEFERSRLERSGEELPPDRLWPRRTNIQWASDVELRLRTRQYGV